MQYILPQTLLLIAACTLPLAAQAPSAGNQVEVSSSVQAKSEHNYLLYLPKTYGNGEPHPLMLFLHGAGERGERSYDLLKVHGPPKLIAAGKEFPFIVVSPQCKNAGWWEAGELSDLLDHIEANYKVDKDRIYVTGLSMGGFGTWSLALFEPDRFAAIAPICGGGNAIQAHYAKPIQAPTWVFHGAKDTVVPLSASEAMVEVLEKQKTPVKLSVYPDAGHDSWTKTYENEKLYEWLLSHRRSDRK